MKLLFVDEFKNNKKDSVFYGITVIVMNNSSYMRFKKGFYGKLKELGWNTKIEIKGCFCYSAKKGDENIGVEERLKFVENLFEMSKTSSKKYASAQIYYTFDIFPKSISEMDMYSNLLYKILKKLPKGPKSGNKNGKNNMVIFLDSNKDLDIKIISEESEKILNTRNNFLVERCVNFSSGNDTPGIIFADHISFFIGNYLKTGVFNENNKERIKYLINRLSENNITELERKELDSFIISLKKESKSKDLLKVIKSMIYIK